MPNVIELRETSLRYPGWRVVLVCFAMALFGWGFGFYGHAVYLAELHRLHGWPTGLIASASTVYYLTGAVLVAFVGDAIKRVGPRWFVLTGVACMAASTALLPVLTALWQLYAAYLLMAFGWAALGLGSITNLIGLWFRERRGLAISVALNGASCGGIVIAPVLVLLSASAGFATAVYVAIAAMLMTLVPLVIAWPGSPSSAATERGLRRDIPADAAPPPPWSKGRALRDAGFWTIAAPFALALTAQVGFIVHQIAFLAPIIGRAGAGWAVAITTTMAVVGRVGLGFVIDRLDQRVASAASFASQAAALFVMTQTENAGVLLAACAVFGFSVGNLITFPALIIQREFEAASFGTLIALCTAIAQFTYAFGPGLLGLVRDLTGGYAAALFVCLGLKLAATAIVLIRPRNTA
ncbi:MAG TPA: MFS transporter [Xanthobacteraceae bacterium]|nr:MFS transporter [Xanthobacteraceae bacterium]